jgi:hypothetical protein
MVVGREVASLARAKRLRDILVGELRFDSSDGVQEHRGGAIGVGSPF